MRNIIAIAFTLLLGTLLLGFVITTINRSRPAPVEDFVQTGAPQGSPSFSWEYKTSENSDDIPQTEIMLAAYYPGGLIVRKGIDTIAGTCNEYSEQDADVYENSTMIICYYAGLGHYFKVVKSDENYLVQRKIFEEASPDYNPPVTGFETIATF